MVHVEWFVLGRCGERRCKEVLYALLQLLSKEQPQGSIEDLIPLISEEGGAAGVDVYDATVVGLIDADQHDCAAAIGPILQHNLLLQPVVLLDSLVDLVVHVLIILYGL
jgi:hypothetical protein